LRRTAQPLLPYETCNLGSLVLSAFRHGREIDYPTLEEAATTTERFLDDVVEVNRLPLYKVARPPGAHARLGLGVMGFPTFWWA
jgi:ribonucleoside-diphosphate reductase alpha chain